MFFPRIPRLLIGAVAAVAAVTAVSAPASASSPSSSHSSSDSRPRTVVTTDMEQDDLASLIRFLLYTNDVDTLGIVYTSGRFHWAGDGKGTPFFLPGREYTTPQTSWRWTGTRTIQDQVLPAYAKVYKNLRANDSAYPSPATLLSRIKVGNIDFEGEMSHDTAGSNLIRDLLLDHDRRPLYLQAWGGTSTIARALKSIEDRYSGTRQWQSIQAAVSRKAVILASGFQDETYASYISVSWPQVRVEQLSAGYATWGYNCNRGQGNTRGPLFSGAWIKQNIQIGPYGSLYRSWLDGQSMPGDQLDIFGDPLLAPGGWCKPLGPYDFLSEGDNVAFNPLLDTGIQAPENPLLGGWGGRATQTTTSPNLWTMVPAEKDASGTSVPNYTTLRWATAAQNDFAARMQWTLSPDGNHAPSVRVAGSDHLRARPGSVVRLRSHVSDPDRDRVSTSWWVYPEEGTYPGAVPVTANGTVTVPADAKPGQRISVILQGTDNGHFPLTRYDRVTIVVA
jgi:hypothetical protein